jgi:hypothetical protein
MQTYDTFAELFSEWEVFQAQFVDKIKTKFLFFNFFIFFIYLFIYFFFLILSFLSMWKTWQYQTVHRWQYNTAHPLCKPCNWGYKHTLGICNTYYFSTSKMVNRTHLNVTLYLHCLSCLSLEKPSNPLTISLLRISETAEQWIVVINCSVCTVILKHGIRHRIYCLFNLGQYQRPVLEVIRSLFHPLPTATIYFVKDPFPSPHFGSPNARKQIFVSDKAKRWPIQDTQTSVKLKQTNVLPSAFTSSAPTEHYFSHTQRCDWEVFWNIVLSKST